MTEKEEIKIGLDTIIARSEEILEAEVGGDTVMMSIEKGQYYGLHGTGHAIWKLLEEPRAVKEICGALVEQYEVQAEQCEQQVITFLRDLAGDGIVRVRAAAD